MLILNHLVLAMSVCGGLILAFCVLLAFVAFKPEKWAAMVDRENAFWIKSGIISAALAARLKRWETGFPLKALTMLVICLLLSLIMMMQNLERQINRPVETPAQPPPPGAAQQSRH